MRRYYDCPKATAHAHPSVTWHLDDVTADAHARRCQVLSWTNVAAAASALAARAGTAARRAVQRFALRRARLLRRDPKFLQPWRAGPRL